MLLLVVFTLDLTQQGYDDMYFWFPVIPEMGVEVSSQSFQIQKSRPSEPRNEITYKMAK